MASPNFSAELPHQPPTAIGELDAMVATLKDAAYRWVRTTPAERGELLKQCLVATEAASRDWVETRCRAQGLAAGGQQEGEAWFEGPATVMRHLRLLVGAMDAGGRPNVPGWRERPDGQKIARVHPVDAKDGLVLPGFTGEIWLEPGAAATQGRLYHDKAAGTRGDGGVCLVLGAGNVSSIGALDALHRLFAADEVVLLKCNPVNDWAGPHYAKSLAPLVDAGFLRICHGGARQGEHLTRHLDVDSIHITGAGATHDRIVWGAPGKQAERKAAENPVCRKPVSSELGCVTPVIVVPGDWTDKDMETQARSIAGMVSHNGSFNCNSAKVLLLPCGWDRKDRFLQKVREALSHTPPRKAYYPGAQERYDRMRKNYPGAIPLGEDGEGILPWTVLPEVPLTKGEYALCNEAFCGVLAEAEVEATTAADFLSKVGKICNDRIWGTLSCMILIDDQTEQAHKEAFEDLLGELKYGGIAVNCWAGIVFGLGSTSWGAFPGHTLADVGSGIGVVHNTFMIDCPQKSVVRAPFRPLIKHIWDPTHKTLHKLGPRMCSFERSPSIFKLLGLAFDAARA